jgi:hypothetical protein
VHGGERVQVERCNALPEEADCCGDEQDDDGPREGLQTGGMLETRGAKKRLHDELRQHVERSGWEEHLTHDVVYADVHSNV